MNCLNPRRRLIPLILCLLFLTFTSSGCGVLLGNVKTVDEKSENYRVEDLAQKNSDWHKLEPTQVGAKQPDTDPTRETDTTDLAFQSKKTASIISLNSACRQGQNLESLQETSHLLFLGISDVTQREETDLEIDHQRALQTTLQGILNSQPVKLRTVVLQKTGCTYDLMYVSRPEHFDSQLGDFTRFVSSLRLR